MSSSSSSRDDKSIPPEVLKQVDSFRIQPYNIPSQSKEASSLATLMLAFQSIGIVFGDIGTSPLYVYPGVFPDGIKHDDDLLGAFSIIFYTLTLIVLLKYAFIVLLANDNGDGGTFALYSLICRHAKVGLIPNEEATDKDVSTYELEIPSSRLRRASKLKSVVEKSRFFRYFLLVATMIGTSMIIGDGILTPCISVLSAVDGITHASDDMTEDMIVWISVAILVALFMVQRFGSDKLGSSFAIILLIWFFSIASTGLYNFFKHDPSILKALNPVYIIDYFKREKKQAWISLGGTVLCITGAEALYADVGHFSVRSIQLSTCFIVYPAIVLQYMGQTSYLRKHKTDVLDAFYKSVPDPLYWPMFGIAILAAIIASQSLISGTFSIIQQSLALGCFPRVKVVHTSNKHRGQVYIPEINYLLMVACVIVTLAFRSSEQLGNAYGLAVVSVMTLTSALLVLIMIMIWKTNTIYLICYIVIIGVMELVYLTAVCYKFKDGGYLPIAFSLVLLCVMYTWNDVYRRRYYYELEHKISKGRLQQIAADSNFHRIPSVAIFYSELVHGIPPIFNQYAINVPVLHSFLIFLTIKSLPISKVPVEERFVFHRVNPRQLSMYRCVVRYGYTDIHNESESFESLLMERLKIYIQEEFIIEKRDREHEQSAAAAAAEEESKTMQGEVELVDKARRAGVVHFVGEHDVIAGKDAIIWKRILINYAYYFLKNNMRQSANKVFDIPQDRMLKVGMTYQLV